jgi:sec-independent protein translocase protein TatA
LGHPAILAGLFGLGGDHLLIIALIVLILFGSRLPKAARGLGQSIKEFKKGVKEGNEPDSDDRPKQIEHRPGSSIDAPSSQEQQSRRD